MTCPTCACTQSRGSEIINKSLIINPDTFSVPNTAKIPNTTTKPFGPTFCRLEVSLAVCVSIRPSLRRAEEWQPCSWTEWNNPRASHYRPGCLSSTPLFFLQLKCYKSSQSLCGPNQLSPLACAQTRFDTWNLNIHITRPSQTKQSYVWTSVNILCLRGPFAEFTSADVWFETRISRW